MAPGPKSAEAVVVESDIMLVVPDNGSDWALGDPGMYAVLRFTQSGWLTGTRVAMENLANMATRQSNELKKQAKGKGVWLEHRTKGKLADATRTYGLVDDRVITFIKVEELPHINL